MQSCAAAAGRVGLGTLHRSAALRGPAPALPPFTRPPLPRSRQAEVDLKALADAKMLKRMRILEEQVGGGGGGGGRRGRGRGRPRVSRACRSWGSGGGGGHGRRGAPHLG